MRWGITFFVNSIVLGIGLAMDAFSVSLANGLREPKMKGRRIALIAGVFAGFQALMPMIGWLCVHTIAQRFHRFESFIPWIALVLLGFIGGSMVVSGIRGQRRGDGSEDAATRFDTAEKTTLWALIVQGIATSIDALSVGFTIADYGAVQALVCALIIAVLTFVICVAGVLLGRKIGTRIGGKAEIFGGILLIGIGLEIFITHMF
ncbi:MAG: manganese efflux pump [Lachnospiraceae bacterium]|nr:manganese efflux pump [Lachnospiraceae bacterium]